MARRRGLAHMAKSSLALALDRAGGTLWVFPRCLALKNPPAVTLGTAKKLLSWADRVESSTPSAGLHLNNSLPIEEQQIANSRYFVMSKTDNFSNVSPFLIQKAITASVGEVKTIRKMRSGDLFIEVSSPKQALALASLKRLAHFDIQVKSHATLNFSR
ncbi:hypothetical protein TNCV_4998891 [Trichonephila clavipes]|nr:hypothetical protein TNCV_4998891 [Trichonephila clavipes]